MASPCLASADQEQSWLFNFDSSLRRVHFSFAKYELMVEQAIELSSPRRWKYLLCTFWQAVKLQTKSTLAESSVGS